jgi:hypothetical protein
MSWSAVKEEVTEMAKPRRYRPLTDDFPEHLRGDEYNAHRNGKAKHKDEPFATPEPWEEIVPVSSVFSAPCFPVNVLPAALGRFVHEASWSLNCPPDYIGVPMLALAGGCMGNSLRLALTETHEQSTALYCGIVGPPGSLKSPALGLVAAPVEAVERARFVAWKKDMTVWKKEDNERRGDKPRVERILLDDVTTEKMADLLDQNPRGLVMVRDELSALITSMNQYKSGKGHDRQVYLKLWSHETIRVDRKSNPDGMPHMAYRPFLTIVGGIQPDVIDRMRGESRYGPPPDDGFLDRFLLVGFH